MLSHDDEELFYRTLALTIKEWVGIETELYEIYRVMMKGAHSHLVSCTFHHIESFESKVQLLNLCFKLLFDKNSSEFKEWKKLAEKSRDLNKYRNRIVHEPIHTGMDKGLAVIEISPSFFDARALAKNKTTYDKPTINSEYKNSEAKIKEDIKIDIYKLYTINKKFKDLSNEISEYKKSVSPKIIKLLKESNKKV